MSNRALVSVLTPVFNCEAFIGAAVRSVWQQTYRPLEHIVVDDGSTDGSLGRVRSLASEAPIPTRVLAPGHRGIAGALNAALAVAEGSLVTVLHADDVLVKTKIERQVAKMEEDPAALLVHSEYLGIDREGERTGYDSDRDLPPARGQALAALLSLQADVRSVTVMFRRELFDKVGGYDERYPVEDWQSILRAASLGPVLHVDEPLVLRRVHGENVSFVAHRNRRFSPAELGWPLLGELLPAHLSLGRTVARHAGVVVQNAVAQGAWIKAARCVRWVAASQPAHAWRLAADVLRGAISWLYLRLRRHLPAGLARRLRRG